MVAVAGDLFYAHGVHVVTMRRIRDAAGVRVRGPGGRLQLDGVTVERPVWVARR
ncbi:hypothetical protein [Streptomyces daliensis]|uniref:Uncharacterized protein n=1 Tax=Streptomyces daliensis TaxID=299421 RepID=A0A8T4IHX5_9ACTN|nr:hypothetical protein [Streptomyces daliensis]